MMKYKYLFSYHINYHKPNFEKEFEYKIAHSHGVVYGNTFLEAMENITAYYGDDSIEDLSIKCIAEECSAIELPYEEVQRLEEEETW